MFVEEPRNMQSKRLSKATDKDMFQKQLEEALKFKPEGHQRTMNRNKIIPKNAFNPIINNPVNQPNTDNNVNERRKLKVMVGGKVHQLEVQKNNQQVQPNKLLTGNSVVITQ